jgi:C4-dicarboxylate transporter, DctQ subunit
MKPLLKWITRLAEFMAALMMAAMFSTFIVQIAVRYSARVPWIEETFPFLDPSLYGWTLEFCLALWLWIVFFGNAFIVRASDHVQFDVFYRLASPSLRRVFLVIGGLAISLGLLWSLEPTWAKFHILRLKKTATLSGLLGDWVRMRDIYVVYVVFLIVVALRFGWMAIQALFYGAPDDDPSDCAEDPGK